MVDDLGNDVPLRGLEFSKEEDPANENPDAGEGLPALPRCGSSYLFSAETLLEDAHFDASTQHW
jgi:hypothetical protein